jgi:hypothetical protein
MTWQDYFDACADNDIYKAFEALAGVGVLPVVNGEDAKGKIKKPLANAWQKVKTDEWRDKLVRFLQEGVPVGIGAKPIGHLVIDVDPKDKNTAYLATAWREMSQAIFGTDDPPKTLTIRTEAGCHVWFKLSEKTAKNWEGKGKREIKLPSGGKAELYVGVIDGGYQVACAPSEGKSISIAVEPVVLPSKAVIAIEAATTQANLAELRTKIETAKAEDDLTWTRNILFGGYLDSELDDYDAWLRVGMALSDRFPAEGAQLWEEWSARNSKHVDAECYAKVNSFKRSGGNVARFGTIVAIVRRNGGPPPPRSEQPQAAHVESIELPVESEPADVETILGLMKEREWLWGDPVQNVGWFVQRGLHLVEGKEGTGKTRWLMDLKRRWGLDLTWPDGSAITMDPDAKMLFVASDSHFDQIAMTAEAYGIDPKSIIFTGPKHDPYNFTSLDDPVTLALIRHWCTKYKVGMVVIDTLMAASSRPLVDPQEVAKIAAPLRDLARELNVAIVLVGHLNSQGETWGRAMGRACDNVIRLEANEMDEQDISIRSVKARWNRFVLPVIKGRQSDSGWEYSTVESEKNDPKAVGGREGAMIAIRDYLAIAGRTSSGDLVAELVERGCAEATVFRTLKFMTGTGELIKITETFPSGKSHPFYDLNPRFGNHDQTPLS